ncbi:hypothetical protein BZG36_04665 [Bifiguratus adelaidae]|uniref:Peptidase S9 prolyl oligopeptidase catalytic domain-containing protein n=1 Tax=Bifiguratus adelaidae TaxID=1938954 RepID=A0A261XWJ2_9FUNG|nr:hypothetical protein BZG36_04665 [Bifiguratus adelaidae]
MEKVLGGLQCVVYGADAAATDRNAKVSVVFIMHGRMGSAQGLEPFCTALTKTKAPSSEYLVLIAFDHPNHGSRLLDKKYNLTWAEGNDTHGLDMWATQYSTAADVSHLIDVVPGYLFPNFDRNPVVRWGVCGISLGGHSTYLAMIRDARLSLAIPIIAAASYTSLITSRFATAPPNANQGRDYYLPPHFLHMVTERQASTHVSRFVGKQLCVLSGGADTLVPWSCNEAFIEALRQAGMSEHGDDDGYLRVVVYDGVGHEVKQPMIDEAVKAIERWMGQGRTSHL